ncbi:hypothetical protein X975_08680, partial [Stegodyphus mimosarum]
MADEKVAEESKGDSNAVNVFTHSSTGFPGAWSEEEISMLLDCWQEVVEATRSPSRRFDVAQKVMVRLRRKGLRVERDVIRKQMNTLRTEYKTYQGLLKIGIPTVRASCVNQLEKILDRTSAQASNRRRDSAETNNHLDAVSEDSDHSHRLSTSFGDEGGLSQNETQSQPEMNISQTAEEVVNQSRRVRFQRRINIARSVRTILYQQQALIDQMQKLSKRVEEINDKLNKLEKE